MEKFWKIKKMKQIKYFSKRPIDKVGRTFNFIIGGRGVGKTFSTIWECLMDGEKFIYMRRTQSEVELISSNGDDVSLSPFAKINKKKGTTMEMNRVNKNVWAVDTGDEENKQNVGIVLSLSTVASIRGFDADDYDALIFDEFIPEKHVKKIGKGEAEGEAFLNAYETLNRDREFQGRKPLRCYLLSNSNNINHPLLSMLGVVNVLERMRNRGQHFVDLPNFDMTITLYDDADFREEKAKTALYKLTRGTKFFDMSIDNDFAYNDFTGIESKNLKEYKPLCAIHGLYIYVHKSSGDYYVSAHRHNVETFGDGENEVHRFYMQYGRKLYGAYVMGALFFENYQVKEKILEMIV